MSQTTAQTRLQVDWSWKKWKTLITNTTTSQQEYIVSVRWTTPDLIFHSASTNTTIGTGSIHFFNIDADCEVHNHPIKIKALKRFKTEYNHLSKAYNPSEPTVLTWTSSSGFKNWDFILLDPEKEPVARFTTDVWAVKKLGFLEFVDEPSLAFKEEVLITGLTLYYCMLARVNNIGALIGSAFATPGPIDVQEEIERARTEQEKKLGKKGSIDKSIEVEDSSFSAGDGTKTKTT